MFTCEPTDQSAPGIRLRDFIVSHSCICSNVFNRVDESGDGKIDISELGVMSVSRLVRDC